MFRFHPRYRISSHVRMNMTPMIDVTFLLLTFFMLASHFASVEKINVDLPQPDNSQAMDRRLKDKVIVNVLYRGSEIEPALRCGPLPVESRAELVEKLEEVAQWNPNTEVILRADRRVPYGHVRRIMQSVASSQLTRLQVVTELNDHGPRSR